MKNVSKSLVLLLLTSSLACAAGREDLLEKAIQDGSLAEVRALLEAGDLDLNKGLGADLKPSLMLAIENLGTELKERPKDIAWYLVAAGFSAIALGGIYKLLFKKAEKKIIVNIPKDVVSVVSTPAPTSVPAAAGVCSAEVQKPQDPTVQVELPKAKKKKFRFPRGLWNAAAGTAGALGAFKKAKDASAPVRTAAVEERLKVVKLLAQQPDINIFAADAYGRNALDTVIAYLSAYDQGSECYACMEEAKKSITERSLREVYELYGDLSKNLGCACTDCSCEDCLCVDGEKCGCNDGAPCPSSQE